MKKLSFCGQRVPRAFSLVEVTLALGIASFAILTVVALLPVGMQSTQDSVDESAAINILSGIVNDRLSSPGNAASLIYKLPALTSASSPAPAATKTFGVQDDNTTADNPAQAHYRVYYATTPPTSGTLNPCSVYLKISWPGGNANPTSFVETTVNFPQP